MNNIINKLIVLKLNGAWQAVGYSTVGKALVDLARGLSAKALDIQYEVDETGEPVGDPISMRPVEWDEWITLPVRSWDFSVRSVKIEVRVPTVLVAKNFAKMPMKEWKGAPSKEAIRIRDGDVDQYTGKVLNRQDGTVDHVLPKSRGGKDIWENLVYTHRKINTEKSNQLNSEVGLKLIRLPKPPKPIPISALIREVRHRDWLPFVGKR